MKYILYSTLYTDLTESHLLFWHNEFFLDLQILYNFHVISSLAFSMLYKYSNVWNYRNISEYLSVNDF